MSRLPALNTRCPASLIQRAEHACRTGQLRMAELYMTRAEQLITDAQNRRHVQALAEKVGPDAAAQLLSMQRGVNALIDAVERVGRAFAVAAEAFGRVLNEDASDTYSPAA